jgi:hypothetical protein
MDETNHGATHGGIYKPTVLNQKESIPACNSYQYANGECEKATVTAKWDVPKATETHHGAYKYGNLAQSVPACNSYQHANGECEKKSATAPYDLPSDNGTSGW